MSWRSKQTEVVPEEAPATDDALAQRLSELTHREVALRRLTESVEQQRTLLEQREGALARSASAALAESEKHLAEAVRRAEQAESRVRDLEARVIEAEARPEPKTPAGIPVVQEPVATSPAPPAPSAPPRARAVDPEATEAPYTLQRLERLVHEAERRGDPQAEEMATYLPLLREHAEADGRLPAQFAPLVDSIFAT